MAKKSQIPDDTYARESFTFRRMTRVAAIILVGGVVYANL